MRFTMRRLLKRQKKNLVDKQPVLDSESESVCFNNEEGALRFVQSSVSSGISDRILKSDFGDAADLQIRISEGEKTPFSSTSSRRRFTSFPATHRRLTKGRLFGRSASNRFLLVEPLVDEDSPVHRWNRSPDELEPPFLRSGVVVRDSRTDRRPERTGWTQRMCQRSRRLGLVRRLRRHLQI